jgi:hypothetical protein
MTTTLSGSLVGVQACYSYVYCWESVVVWELLTVPVRTASDYRRDFVEIYEDAECHE